MYTLTEVTVGSSTLTGENSGSYFCIQEKVHHYSCHDPTVVAWDKCVDQCAAVVEACALEKAQQDIGLKLKCIFERLAIFLVV